MCICSGNPLHCRGFQCAESVGLSGYETSFVVANLAKAIPGDYWIPTLVSFQSNLRPISFKNKKKAP